MAITNAMCTVFKRDLFRALHNFDVSDGSAFKIALYTSAATLGAATTAYTVSGEVSGTGYTIAGAALTNAGADLGGTTGFADFEDVSWSDATFTANGALIYNTRSGNPAVCALAFGADKSVSAGTFTIQFPVADAANAILRIA